MSKYWLIAALVVVGLSALWVYKIVTNPVNVVAYQAQQAAEEAKKKAEEQGWVDWAVSKLPSLPSMPTPDEDKDESKDPTPGELMQNQFKR